ncbi:outer membrane protein [Thalassospira alkalitolerans]|uniref:Outer membrane protein beta-barrel domain-containing protein n=1 Tax=Thalassospira alkalitolerans TaxID=1293890 RepID=A0A1Y2L5M8_9PROT|nr:outer membrane beta-barrel protein [Thalassospira alkalitolerans]OSQ42780.1 hypothetical protein TALK_21230 [Thalassospira alkalitolerans]|tara:strand:+ start:10298 stop:11077 length:780 start_codon:yes stop_codon:yes gene_type:complete
MTDHFKRAVRGAAIFVSLATAVPAFADETTQNWQGFYGGIALGGAYSAASPDTEALTSSYFDAEDKNQLAPVLHETIEGFDVTGSALFGYDYQDQNVIYGIEGDLTFMPFSETESHGPETFTSNATVNFTSQTTVETDVTFSIRPKIGYAMDDWQVYVSAGPSISRFKTTHKYNDTSKAQNHVFTDTRTAFGVSSSVGAGYRIGNGWSLRGDYVLTYFPQIVNGDANAETSGVIDPNADFSYDSDFLSHNVRFALIKRF